MIKEYDYSPERWLILKLQPTNGDDLHYRVFGTWGGGYIHGQSWQLNSGIMKVRERDDWFYFDGHSGSVYRCHKKTYGAFSYGISVLSNLVQKSKEYVTITQMPEDTDWFKLEYN